jgi:hypothetical protein
MPYIRKPVAQSGVYSGLYRDPAIVNYALDPRFTSRYYSGYLPYSRLNVDPYNIYGANPYFVNPFFTGTTYANPLLAGTTYANPLLAGTAYANPLFTGRTLLPVYNYIDPVGNPYSLARVNGVYEI